MVHALDLATAKARCIDLPGTATTSRRRRGRSRSLADGRTLWAANPSQGRVVGDRRPRAQGDARLQDPGRVLGTRNGTRAALSPDGNRIALADGETVAVVGLTERKLVPARKSVGRGARLLA